MKDTDQIEREKTIVKVSIQGIFVNLVLVTFKAVVGIMANSIAVILDAVNNLSDAFSQVVTIVGTKLSSKRPDKNHPYGYGRIEYLSSSIVASVVILAGLTSFKESVSKTISPAVPEYSTVSFVIISVAVVVKFLFGRYVKSVGKKIDSQALLAVGTDSAMDSLLSLSTLVAAFVSKFLHFNVEGILGLVLSVFIIKAGFEILKETIGSLIGDRTDGEFAQELKKQIRSFEGVLGVYDLILHDYGETRSIGSVHIEVPGDMSAKEIHILTRRIANEIHEKYRMILTIGVYASNNDAKTLEMKDKVSAIALSHENVMQIHGFFVDEERKRIVFDMVVSYKEKDIATLFANVKKEIAAIFPDYKTDMNIDNDFSD